MENENTTRLPTIIWPMERNTFVRPSRKPRIQPCCIPNACCTVPPPLFSYIGTSRITLESNFTRPRQIHSRLRHSTTSSTSFLGPRRRGLPTAPPRFRKSRESCKCRWIDLTTTGPIGRDWTINRCVGFVRWNCEC